MFRDEIYAAIRTAAAVAGPGIILAIVTFFARYDISIEVDGSVALALTGLLTAVLVGLWNLAINWATEYIHPWFGYLLILNKAPVYGVDDGIVD